MGFSVTRKLIEKRFSKAALDVYNPKTIEERRAVAGRCEQSLGYGVKTNVDEMDNKVCEAYTGWPTGLFLIGTDGRIVYRGSLAPGASSQTNSSKPSRITCQNEPLGCLCDEFQLC